MKPSLLFCLPNPKLLTFLILSLATLKSYGQQSWIEVPTPDPSETRNMLRDITGTSSNDVWTVGSYETSPGNMKNLILHWNGSAWQSFSGTDQSNTHNDLWGVTSVPSRGYVYSTCLPGLSCTQRNMYYQHTIINIHTMSSGKADFVRRSSPELP